METAFHEIEIMLRDQIREAELDHEAFAKPLKVCDLSSCRATCCHDGVFLSDGEKAVLEGVVGELDGIGPDAGAWFEQRKGRWKTAVAEAREEQLWDEFPAHFSENEVRVSGWGAQVPAAARVGGGGKDGLVLEAGFLLDASAAFAAGGAGRRPRLTLAAPENDPASGPGYPGFSSFTPCGRFRECGQPAWAALRGELELLGRIGGRDLVRELSGREVDPGEGPAA